MSACVKFTQDYKKFKGQQSHYVVFTSHTWLSDLASLVRFLRPGVYIEAWEGSSVVKMTHVVE